MVTVLKSLPDFDSPYNPGKYRFQCARWRIVCLALLLILGQALLLHHVVQHGQEHAIGLQDDDGCCSFCVVGGHMVTHALSFQPVPSSILVWVLYFLPAAQYFLTHYPQAFEARGPPLLSVA